MHTAPVGRRTQATRCTTDADHHTAGRIILMTDLLDKAWRVINSCQTPKQARGALRYLELLADRYPDLDVSPLRRELATLFDL